MKNKIALLIFVFTANFSFTNLAYCQPVVNDVCSPDPYIETPNSNFDCGVYDAYRYASLGVGGRVTLIPKECPDLQVNHKCCIKYK